MSCYRLRDERTSSQDVGHSGKDEASLKKRNPTRWSAKALSVVSRLLDSASRLHLKWWGYGQPRCVANLVRDLRMLHTAALSQKSPDDS